MILFLDTVSPFPKFLLIENNKIKHSIQILNKNSNKISDSIIPTFLKMQNNLRLHNRIKKLIVCKGPGSYTALRIGISFMYGLSIASNIPLIGISYSDIFNFNKVQYNKKTLLIICSGNDQNYIFQQKKNNEFEILKFNKNSKYKINFEKYDNCVSNSKLFLKLIKKTNIKKYKIINIGEVVCLHLKQIFSLPINDLIVPIYISDNKNF